MPDEGVRRAASGEVAATPGAALSSPEVERTLARVPIGCLLHDAAFRIVVWNPACERLLGYRAEQVVGRTPYEIVAAASHPVLQDMLRGLAAGDGTARGECEHVTADGDALWCAWTLTPWLDDAGERIGGLALIEDVTARRDTEERARDSEARNASLLATAPYAIVSIDETGEIVSVNPAAEALFGYRGDEMVGRNITMLMGGAHVVRHDEYLKRYLATGEARVIGIGRDVVGRHRDGREIPVRLSVGEAVYGGRRMFIGILHDLRETRHLEQRLQQAQKMDAIGRLAGGVAHDFNNVLTIALSASELALLELPAEHPIREVLQEVRDAGERGAVLTRQLLALSRRGVPTLTRVDVGSLVQGMRKMLSRLLGEDIELTVTAEDGGAPVRADVGLLEQVVLNLAINARDAMPSGGALRVSVRVTDLDAAYARQNPGVTAGPHVVLEIADDGVGMDAETREHLFEPFFTTKEQGQGTGLGLATVYGIVTQAGGHIEVDSAPGQGATFRVYLPREDDDEAAAAAPRAGTRSDDLRGDEVVLLVEDDSAVRAMARKALAAHGYAVLEAADGKEALRVEEEHQGPIHLLVTDVVMPRLSGRQLAERLIRRRPDLRVVYMSGYTSDAVLLRGVTPDTSFLHKPFTPRALARTVRLALDRA
jgi:two-component system cell cycle sensor histidine kinase/response regulator CckA